MKRWKKLMTAIMSVVMASVAVFCVGCGKINKEESKVSVEEKPNITEYDGQIVRTGGQYALSGKIAFLGSDVVPLGDGVGQSNYTPTTITLTATVKPADANQAVWWHVEFENADDPWAVGKNVSDYVTVSTETEGSTTASVTCHAPFGEQIKIVCTSQDNPSIFASCIVDFVEAIEGMELTFGEDLPINFGGKTEIVWEINPSGVGKGGQANIAWYLIICWG